MNMKKLTVSLMICLAMAATALDANAAKRIGGGSSFGRPAPSFTQKAPAATPAPSIAPAPSPAAAPRPAQTQQPNAAGTTAPKPQSTAMGWLGRIGMALGLASLFSFLGLGGGSMGLILLLVVVGGLFMLMRSRNGAAQPATSTSSNRTSSPDPFSRESSAQGGYDAPDASRAEEPIPSAMPMGQAGVREGSVMDRFMRGAASSTVAEQGVAQDITPADFDREGFLKVALENYRLLQKAWDTGNVTQISEFTTDDVFIAITHQLRERGNVLYTSEVKELSNELLGITEEGDEYVAAVKFTGKILIDGDAEDIAEIWTLVKRKAGNTGWQLAGIKQLEGSTL